MADYFAAVRSGDPISEATVHESADCSVLVDAPLTPRPIRQGLVDATDPDLCGECSEAVAICTVTKTDGEECGRERPCAYHD